MTTTQRIGLWFGALFLSVALFSLLYMLYGPASFFFVFRIMMILAFPVACLYLPVVIALKDAEGARMWTMLGAGILIGPAALVLWALILQASDHDVITIWQGDGIGFGVLKGMVLASIVGLLTTAFYLISLKVTHWRSILKP